MENGVLFIKENHQVEEHVAKYSNAQIIKKYKEGSCEINIYILPGDRMFFINAAEHDNAIKTYYIINGKCLNTETNEILEAGDMIIVKRMEGMLNFKVIEDMKVLVHANNNEAFEQFADVSVKVTRLLDEIQAKDHYTKEHCERVFGLAQNMALLLGYKADRLYNLNMAARYHDIGKIYIEDEILNKPGKLDDQEYEKMKEHVLHGGELVQESFDARIFDIISQHHERMDGSGYPKGRKGDEILQEARILAICDSYDAMVTDRVYKKGKSTSEALKELQQLAGTKYDAELVQLFVKMLMEL